MDRKKGEGRRFKEGKRRPDKPVVEKPVPPLPPRLVVNEANAIQAVYAFIGRAVPPAGALHCEDGRWCLPVNDENAVREKLAMLTHHLITPKDRVPLSAMLVEGLTLFGIDIPPAAGHLGESADERLLERPGSEPVEIDPEDVPDSPRKQ